MTRVLAGGGVGWERDVSSMLDVAAAISSTLTWHRHEPKMAGKIRVSGGLPDFEAVLNGRAILIEAKHESAASMGLGRLVGPDNQAGAGVKPSQARIMDAHMRSGASCWIAARLELTATQARKLANPGLFGGGDVPAVIQRLVPWAVWRARMEAAESARRRGVEPEASIPAAELAEIGMPLRTGIELLRALEDNNAA